MASGRNAGTVIVLDTSKLALSYVLGQRQSWHTYTPYTDRIDYLGGVMNNLPYVLAVEQLAGIDVHDQVKVMRIMLAELFRLVNSLVWYGTFAQNVGTWIQPTRQSDEVPSGAL